MRTRVNLAESLPKVRRPKKGEKPFDRWDNRVRGLHARVSRASVAFRVLVRVDGRSTVKTIGRWRSTDEGGADPNRGFLSVSQARVLAQQVLGLASTGVDSPLARRITVAQMIRECRRRYEGEKPKNTVRKFDADERNIARHLGDYIADEVTKADVREMHRRMQVANGHCSANSAARRLRMWYRIAIDERLVSRHETPVATRKSDQGRVRLVPEAPNHKNTLTRDEVEAMFSAIDAAPFSQSERDALRLMLWRGLRANEIANLRWGNVDLRRAVMTLDQHKTVNKVGALVLDLDTQSEAMLAEIRPARAMADDPVFPTPSGPNEGRPLSERRIQNAWRKARAIAGVSKTAQGARRAFITGMIEDGVPLPIVKEMMGHASISTTANYATPSRSAVRAALRGGY